MCILCSNQNIDPASIFLDCAGCPAVRALPEDLPDLKFLVMHDTQIQTVPAYPSLEGLYMMGCPVSTLPELPKLRKLNACRSKLESIPDSLYRLESLLVDGAPLSSLPETLISIRSISANDCASMTELSPKLINLESLSIARTAVESVPALMSLQYIDISGTAITQLPTDQLPGLRKVFARGCSLSDPFSLIDRGIDLTS